MGTRGGGGCAEAGRLHNVWGDCMKIAFNVLVFMCIFLSLGLTGCQNSDLKDPYEINVIKAKTLPLGIPKGMLIPEMRGAPLQSSGFTKDEKYEIIYFKTPPINSENVGVLVEVSSQQVVGFRVYEWVYRALDQYVDVVRKEFNMTSDKAQRLP